jgi:hypothetical protein
MTGRAELARTREDPEHEVGVGQAQLADARVIGGEAHAPAGRQGAEAPTDERLQELGKAIEEVDQRFVERRGHAGDVCGISCREVE